MIHDELDVEASRESYCAIRLEWDGSMVDAYPAGDHSVSEMLECDLSEPMDDIYEANDTDRFDAGEFLGFVYFESPNEYDLRVK